MDGPHPAAGRAPAAAGWLAPCAFTLCLAPILLGAGLWIALGPVDLARPAAWLAVGLVTLGWWGSLACARRVPDSFALTVVLASGALALRVGFLASELALSDDVNRYVWEGALVAEGLDPYRLAPAAPELAEQRARWGELHAELNHPEVPAAYPPLAQALHAGVVALAGGAEHPARARLALRLLYGCADLLVCLPLAVLLARRGRPRAWLAAWAWNPWVAQEFAGAAHLDALALLCALAALACVPVRARLAERGAHLAAVLLAAGALLKLLPAAFAPFVLRRARRPAGAALVFLGALGLGCLPFVLRTGALPGAAGIGEYAFRWESFSLLHRWLEPLFARFHGFDERWNDPRRLARAVELLAWLGLAHLAWRRRLEPARAAAWLCAGFLALTPTLHPWYLAWSVPFLALRPALPWLALASLAPLLYAPLARWRAEGLWVEPRWLYPLVVGVLGAALLLELLLRRPRGRA